MLINIHAHSIFSDGQNSPYHMALTAKELGFTALVITDHYYGDEHRQSITKSSMRLLKKACLEAREIIPVIIGLEVPFMGQEVLVFGGAAIKDILENGKPTMERMLQLKQQTGCAVILCHPCIGAHLTEPAIDGYELINGGMTLDINFDGKPAWCNSDAHSSHQLRIAYNIVDTKITTESDLIGYIKKGKQPEFKVGTI